MGKWNTINQIEAHIDMCIKRRKEQRIKGKSIVKLNKTLHSLRITLRSRKTTQLKMEIFNKKIREYFGMSIKNNLCKDRKTSLARKFFYRWGLEAGIKGTFLRGFVGNKNIHCPSESRLSLIRNKEQNELYKRFLIYEP